MTLRTSAIVASALSVASCGGRSSLDTQSVMDAGAEQATQEGVVSISPSSVDFGAVPCGMTAAARVVVVSNTGTAPFSFTASLGLGAQSSFVIAPKSDVVAPGGTASIVVWPNAIPVESLTASNMYGDTLSIATDLAGDSTHVVALDESAFGAIVQVIPPSAFGNQLVGTSPTTMLTIANSGDAPATFHLSTQVPFSIASPVSVPAQSSIGVPISFTPDPTMLGLGATATIDISTTDGLCAPVAQTSFNISGTASDSATRIEAAGNGACAIGQSGNLYCWGYVPGNGTTTSKTPALALAKGAMSLGTGDQTMCMSASGSVQCWGLGTQGQLGDGYA